MSRRNCVFNAELARKFPFIQSVPNKTRSDVFCTVCNSEFDISNSGRTDVNKHIESKKHFLALQAKSMSQPITNFAKPIDYKNASHEGVWAYHVIKANNSFRSTDCTSKLFRECFGLKDFHCARTKTEAIVTNVIAPFAQNVLKEELKNIRFVTCSTDASNHGNIKMMPVVVRYFIPTIGVRVKMLEFSTLPNETSETIADLIRSTARNNGIEDKVTGFCADNCSTNFGSRVRSGQNNVFYRLKLWNPNMIGIGCAAHIVHNTLKSACEQLPFDIECIVVKIYKHFYINTVRVEALKSICELYDEIEFSNLLGYANTRFLALAPAVNRILELFDPLKTYFQEFHGTPKILKSFFASPLSRLVLLFIKEQVNIDCSFFK